MKLIRYLVCVIAFCTSLTGFASCCTRDCNDYISQSMLEAARFSTARCNYCGDDWQRLCCCANIPSWAVMLYYGRTTKNTLGKVLSGEFCTDSEKLYSLEGSYVFPPNSLFVNWIGCIFGRLEFCGNMTVHCDDDIGIAYEFIPYICAGFNNFFWNHIVHTTVSVGEGVSWITKVPKREKRNTDRTNRLLNYLMFEIALAHPHYKQYQFVIRVHHRSGVFGLYNAENSGSTAVGLGFRYYFGGCKYPRRPRRSPCAAPNTGCNPCGWF